jgi:hypothetical protein
VTSEEGRLLPSSAVIRKTDRGGETSRQTRWRRPQPRAERAGAQKRFRAEGSSAFSPRRNTGRSTNSSESILGPGGEVTPLPLPHDPAPDEPMKPQATALVAHSAMSSMTKPRSDS